MLFLFLLITLFFMLLMLKSYDNNIMLYEGMKNKYEDYDDNNNPLILAQKNAGNIDYLKQRVEENSEIKDEIKALTKSVELNKYSIKQLGKTVANIMSHHSGMSEKKIKEYHSGNIPGAPTATKSEQSTEKSLNPNSNSNSKSTPKFNVKSYSTD